MIIGINNEPYLDLSSYIDIDGLRAMHKEICLGIAKSKSNTTIYGTGLGDLSHRKSFIDLAKQYANSVDEIDKEISKTLDWNQRAVFFKLYEGMYNASHVVTLRGPPAGKRMENYFFKGKASFTEPTPDAQHFLKLLDWIYKLPIFSEIGRIIFFLNEHDCSLQMHMDSPKRYPHRDEFVWINPTGKKRFWILDPETKEKTYIESSAAFFNSMDWHGGDAIPTYEYSLRIDGKFTDDFREQLGISHLETY
jgi:hypothetical protein